MTKRLWIVPAALAAGCVLAAGLSSPVSAQKDKPKDAGKDSPEVVVGQPDEQAEAMADIAAAYRLVDYAERDDGESKTTLRRRLALLTAAQMLRTAPKVQPLDAKLVVGADKGPATLDPDPLLTESNRLLDKADEMAKSDPSFKDLIKRVRDGKRGGLNGPLFYTMRLRAGQADTYNLKFKKNQPIRITIRNMGNSSLNIEARNVRNYIRASDGGRNPSIGWNPHQDDGTDYKVTVRNRGPNDVTYNLLTN